MRRGWADDLRKAREKQSKKPKEEEEEDCVILDGDPNKPLEVKNELENEIDELVVVAEKGQIACRDYPHARHLCVTFPFNTNPHEKYCDLCHCYVCDTLAPCVYWVWGTDKSSDDHCHATDKEEMWRELRQRSKEEKLAQLQVSGLLETTLSNEPLCHQAVNCSQPLNVNEETQLQVSGLLETTLSSEPLRHQALNCSQPLNVNEERVVQLELMSLALDRSTVQGDRLTGIVKWFDSHKGYGFISTEDGCEDLFVHHSSIKSKGHQSLAEGERVEFEIEIDDHGRGKATNVSGPGGSFVPGTSGRDNCGIDFSMRGGRGPGDRIYGGRASASRRGYGRNKDTGASSLGGSIFQGITRKDNYGISDSDASRCYKCGEMGHLARNCNGIGGGIGNSDSDASRCYKCGEMGHLARNCNGIGGGISNSDSDASACYKCGEMGHLARNCNGIGGGIGNSDSDASGCYKCGEMGHLARNCNGLGGGIGNNFRVRVDRGGGRKGYGSRASVSYRGGDSGRNRAAGVSSPGGSFLQETTSSNTGSDTPKCYNCGEIGHLTRNCDDGGGGRDNGLNGSVHRVRVDRGGGRISAYRRGDLERNKAVGVSSVDRFDNLLREREIFACFKCGELGHSSRDCDVGGGSNGFNRGGGRKDYGSRASVSYRGGNSGRNRAAGVRSPGGSFLQETTSSNRDSDTPKCYNCGEIGHLTRNCDGGGGGRDNGLNGSVHRVRVDRGGGRISAHRRGDLERNKAVGVSSVDRLDNWLREMENFPCLKCGELGHSSRDCDVGGGSNGFNRGYTVGSYNRSDNRQRGGCDGGTNSGRSGSFELSNSRYNERNRTVSMRRPNGNLPRGNTRRDDHYGEIGNSTRDRPSMERGSGGCYICGKLGHQARDCYKERGGGRSEDGVSSCTCGEAGHLPDCPKKQDGGSGAEVPCFTCHEPGHLPIDCPKKHQIWRELHFGF